ncbi:MAG: Smr/MutS family protein, partial [Oscillospiraceae bacterium]|nr:Smr/MutS family protein [Oscillospiraceae bacterium]
ENTLLLFDELGAGTDPTEGAALAIAIIEHARAKGSMIAATTHYAEMKIYATTTEGVQNASCEFDVETLRPTYRLLIGVPGKSNAFAISKRLGLPEEIIRDAESRIDSESRSFEEVLQNLEFARQQIEREEQDVRLSLRKAEEDAAVMEKLRAEIEREREKAAKIAKREADRILREARQTAELVFDELNEMKKQAKKQNFQKANEQKTGVYKVLNDAEDKLGVNEPEPLPPPSSRPVKAGDRVKLLSLGTEADVIAVNADGTLQLQAGIMKINAKEDEVRLVEVQQQKKQTPSTKSSHVKTEVKREAAKAELDIRGMMTDEAIPLVEKFLDNAKMGKLNVVTIIHGKGTGALRKAVHECLRHEKGIKHFRLGVYGEGESGVTVVEFK